MSIAKGKVLEARAYDKKAQKQSCVEVFITHDAKIIITPVTVKTRPVIEKLSLYKERLRSLYCG